MIGALGIQLFVPSKQFMTSLISTLCITSPWRYMDLRSDFAVVSNHCDYISPDQSEVQRLGTNATLPRCIDQCNPHQFALWWDQTSFATRPSVRYFDAFIHLLDFDISNMLHRTAQDVRTERNIAIGSARDWFHATLCRFLPGRVVSKPSYEKRIATMEGVREEPNINHLNVYMPPIINAEI